MYNNLENAELGTTSLSSPSASASASSSDRAAVAVSTAAAVNNPTLLQLMKLERENRILKALVNPDEVVRKSSLKQGIQVGRYSKYHGRIIVLYQAAILYDCCMDKPYYYHVNGLVSLLYHFKNAQQHNVYLLISYPVLPCHIMSYHIM